MIVTLHDRVFKKSNSDRRELCACANTLLTLQIMASIKCQYNADNASMQGRAETTTWKKDLANQLHVSYNHAVIIMNTYSYATSMLKF